MRDEDVLSSFVTTKDDSDIFGDRLEIVVVVVVDIISCSPLIELRIRLLARRITWKS